MPERELSLWKPVDIQVPPIEPVYDDGDWASDAKCAGLNDDTFYPVYTTYEAYQHAVAYCTQCVVRAECLGFALKNDEVHGIWGGYDSDERHRIQTKMSRRKRQLRGIPHETDQTYT